ncbi:MAG: arsenosugar biosynthesis radical SAM protein ArsS [Gammaproteobacteria bacterium]|nr:arsenosugar biosynthesis radical SAM protein ArsS [Gammaproteobacteria bacterium]
MSGPAPSFAATLRANGLPPLVRAPLQTLQINVGRRCNQACHHCHVDAGPKRPEVMTAEVARRVVDWALAAAVTEVDITGGAPELNPEFRWMVDTLRTAGVQVISRCNLTVLFEPGQQDLAEWYAGREVRLVCSLPCYTRDNTDAQRGDGVFDKSIAALQLLNQHGYGAQRQLDLVYNPGGAFLPPDQQALEREYRERLLADFGVRFSRLLALANLPINRFAHFLERSGQRESYQLLLQESFNVATVDGLMCRQLLSVDWLGQVFDCDFNQMLDLPLGGTRRYLWDLDPATLPGKPVAVDAHCFGCTAGAGSSCGGSLVAS